MKAFLLLDFILYLYYVLCYTCAISLVIGNSSANMVD